MWIQSYYKDINFEELSISNMFQIEAVSLNSFGKENISKVTYSAKEINEKDRIRSIR